MIFFNFFILIVVVLVSLYFIGILNKSHLNSFKELIHDKTHLLIGLKSINEKDSGSEKNLRIRIPRMRFDQVDRTIHYQMIIKYNGVTWDTWRRYSEFRNFCKTHDFDKDATFPPKSTTYEIMSGYESTLEFIDKRRKKLETFMNSVISDETKFGQSCVFLKTKEERVGPSGRFFSVPLEITFENIKLNPSRVEIFQSGLTGFEYVFSFYLFL